MARRKYLDEKYAALRIRLNAMREAKQIYDGQKNSIHAACVSGNTQQVRELGHDNQALLNNTDEHGNFPLLLAIFHQHLQVIRTLLEFGATQQFTFNLEDYDEDFIVPAMCIAAQMGNLEIVKLLVEFGANIEDGMTEHTPLHEAASHGHMNVLLYLLEKGASIDALAYVFDDEKLTPLYMAAEKGHLEVVRTLVDRGANVNAGGSRALSILAIAAKEKHLEVARLLLDRGANVNWVGLVGDVLKAAVESGEVEIVRLLIQHNVTLTGGDYYGKPHLRFAAIANNLAIVQLLLENGADVNINNSIEAAASNGHEALVELFFKYGANPNGINSALIGALENGHLAVAKTLIANGANVNAKRIADDMTALHLLCSTETCEEACEVAQMLIQKGADLNATVKFFVQDKDTDYLSLLAVWEVDAPYTHAEIHVTPLHLAIYNECADLVWVLAAHGSLITFRANEPVTVWDFLEKEEDVEGKLKAALLHFWTPSTHCKHPKAIRDVIVSTMLVSKRQHWPFDKSIMHLILSFIAYSPFTVEGEKENNSSPQDHESDDNSADADGVGDPQSKRIRIN